MTRPTSIRSFSGIMIILILLVAIVCSAVNVIGYLPVNSREVISVSKSGTPSKSDSQLPEKIEVENDLKSNDHFFFIQEVSEFFEVDTKISQSAFLYNVFRFCVNTTRTPQYLVQRSILI